MVSKLGYPISNIHQYPKSENRAAENHWHFDAFCEKGT